MFTKIPVCMYMLKHLVITILSSLSLMQLFFCHKSPWQIMTPPCLHFLQPLLCTEHHFGWWPQAFKPSTFIFSASLSCFFWLSFLFSPDHTATSPLVAVFHLVPTSLQITPSLLQTKGGSEQILNPEYVLNLIPSLNPPVTRTRHNCFATLLCILHNPQILVGQPWILYVAPLLAQS